MRIEVFVVVGFVVVVVAQDQVQLVLRLDVSVEFRAGSIQLRTFVTAIEIGRRTNVNFLNMKNNKYKARRTTQRSIVT